MLPEPATAGWQAGADAAPTQLLRCPVLQLPEHALLPAGAGRRAPEYRPLPSPATHAGP